MPKKINFLFLAILFFVSCDTKAIFDSYESLPNQWNKNKKVTFKFQAPDTINNYNLFINLRNNNAYNFSNLYVITGLEYPNGKTIIDTLEYKMATPDGKLLGEGFSDVKENKLWYKGHKQSFVFSEIGEYTFKIEQAMRKYDEVKGVDDLKGITEVGFRVEKK